MILKNGMVFYKNKFQKLDIEIRDKYIYKVESNIDGEDGIDISGMKVIPGVIDIHTHGCMGHDFTRATKEDISDMVEYYIENGITSILATVMTDSKLNLENAVREIAKWIDTDNCIDIHSNNVIKGINLEGPFFGIEKRGAHDRKYLKEIDEDFFDSLNYYSGNNIKIVTIDPNLKGSEEFINKYRDKLIVSLGHTSCNYSTGCRAIKMGAKHITHLFNAMNGLHHRNSGLIGTFSDNDITAELICDGVHIDESVIRMIYKIAGDRVIIISDSIIPTGLGDGKYISGGLEVEVKNNMARLYDGTIAGSITNCFEGMKRAIQYGIPEDKAILSATAIPAKLIGIDNEVGYIEDGKLSDMIIVNNEYDIKFVIKNGVIVNSK